MQVLLLSNVDYTRSSCTYGYACRFEVIELTLAPSRARSADESEADIAALWRRACDDSEFVALLPLPSGASTSTSTCTASELVVDSSSSSSSSPVVLALATRSGLLFHVLALPDSDPETNPHCWQLHLLEAVDLGLPLELLAQHKAHSLSLLPGELRIRHTIQYNKTLLSIFQ